MKKVILLLLLLISCSVRFAYGDEIKSIKLDNKGHDKEMIQLSFCNIFVELQKGADENQYVVSVKLENISEDKILYLFDKSYSEKALKKTCNIVYEKLFPGAKEKRTVEACEGLMESCRLLPSSESKSIVNFQGDLNSIKCRLPIYIARTNETNFIVVKKSKIALAQKEVIELNVDVELKPDEDLLKLTEVTDSLIDEIGKQKFCSNRNHNGTSAKAMIEFYTMLVEDLKGQIQKACRSHNYYSTDKGYKLYAELLDKLNAVNLDKYKVTSCKNDRKVSAKPTHNCRYCTLSMAEIYKKMESYLIALHNGTKTKAQIIGDVEALYNCAKKNRKRSAGNYMSRISDFYSKIKSK